MLGLGGAFVLVMLGTRMSTLSFGQVFSAHRDEDVKRIAQLEIQVDTLRSENRRLSFEADKVKALQTDNESLQAYADALKEKADQIQVVEKPIYITRTVTAPSPEVGGSKKSPVSAAIVHRGDGPDVVRKVFGKPSSVKTIGDEEYWYYHDSYVDKVVFKDGVVAEWDGMPVEP